MPVIVVVGGQYGSEGKGKIAQYLARMKGAAAVVRVGGSNSGHTGVDANGQPVTLRHLPTAALLPEIMCVLGPGSYIDPEILLSEIERVDLDPARLLIDRNAYVITAADRDAEATTGLRDRIGSTASGTGASVMRRIQRRHGETVAQAAPELAEFVVETTPFLREISSGGTVIVEGTQGFGLSVLHGPHLPYATSRDTSASAALSEAGLPPKDVEVVLVLRAHPIRVAGNSGPLVNEIDWETVTNESGYEEPRLEYTSVTQKVRRVARFDPELVRRAIAVNAPDEIALNHLDYVDADWRDREVLPESGWNYVHEISRAIDHEIRFVGTGPGTVVDRSVRRVALAS